MSENSELEISLNEQIIELTLKKLTANPVMTVKLVKELQEIALQGKLTRSAEVLKILSELSGDDNED